MITRRHIVGLMAGLSSMLVLTRVRADEGACAKLDSLPRSQRRMRDNLGFQIQSKNEQMCRDCAFFSPDTATSNCGSCELLNGGAVYSTSVCDSWGAK